MLACIAAVLLCAQKPAVVPDDPALIEALRAMPSTRALVETAAEHRVQILLATVGADAKGRPVLARRGYRVDAEYYYPASAVKLIGAIAALEDLDERRIREPRLSEDTPLVFHPLFEGEVIEDRDPTHLADGRITLRHEIRKLFLVSDNAAFNR